MQKFQDAVFNTLNQPASGVSVLVRPTGVTTQTSTIYGDIAGTATRANPLTTDSNGRFSFYAADCRFSLTISGNGVTTTTVTVILLV